MQAEEVLGFEGFTLDVAGHSLSQADGRDVPLTAAEFSLLTALVRHAGRVQSRDQLREAVVGRRAEPYDRSIDVLIGRLRRKIEPNPKSPRLIFTVPGAGYKFGAKLRAISQPPGAAIVASRPSIKENALSIPDKPSIAVLPFVNMSGDQKQEYFADGVVEEIITALSHFSSLFVIARNSSFTYKGRVVDLKQVGRELGVRYVVEGSVRKSGKRIRISGQLIDAAMGVHLWAGRFDGSLRDIFDLQDQVTMSIVGAVAPKVEQAEIERAKRKPTENLSAYDHFLRGMASVYRPQRAANAEALQLFYRAIDVDQDFASALGMAAWCYVQRKSNGWWTDRPREIAEAETLARRGASVGRDNAIALSRSGHALAYLMGDLDVGASLIDRALTLNPNMASAWRSSGWVRVWRGEPSLAIEHFARAMRLSPLDPEFYSIQTGIAYAHFFSGRYDEAWSWADRASRDESDFLPAFLAVAASRALGGDLKGAQKAMTRARLLDPSRQISKLRDNIPLRRAEDLARYAEGLRKAGMPE